MARKKQGPLDDLIDITAMLPWWVGVLLAITSYFVCLHYANAEVARVTSIQQAGAMVSGQLVKVFAMIGQYILPLVFMVGAGLSAWGRHRRDALFTGVQASASTSALNDMSWQEFELLVGEAFRRKGYAVSENGGGGADGGIDLVLRKDGQKYLAQCKQWRAYKVGVTTVRELYGVMSAEGAAGGFVVTSGVFTQDARDFTEGRNIELIDGSALTAMIGSIRHGKGNTTQPFPPKHVASIPSCPKCGSQMVKRTARQGANAGNAFWGCSNYPQCRGIVAID